MQKKLPLLDSLTAAHPGRRGMPAQISEHALLPHVRPAIVMLLLFTVLTGVIYPLAMTGVAQIAFPAAANGSLQVKNNTVVGSELIGQAFSSERYFRPRPSATTAPDPRDASKSVGAPYNAANSAGSNLGPLSKALQDRVVESVQAIQRSSGASGVPADAVTTSASGLDPDISPANALQQVRRIAKARKLPEDRVRQLVTNAIDMPAMGFVGEPHINVLQLNLALDAVPSS